MIVLKEAFEKKYRNERRIELAFEEHRFFDVRWWKILDQTDKSVTGGSDLVRTGRAVEVITAYGNRIKSNPLDYYYPAGAVPRSNAFTNLDLVYALPADEAALSPHF